MGLPAQVHDVRRAGAGHTRPPRGSTWQICAVLNPTDDVAAARHLATVHDRRRGVIVVLPTPGATRTELGLDILVALGKTPPGSQRGKLAEQVWDLASAWIRGEDIRNLVLDRAHLLDSAPLNDIARLCRDSDVNLWMMWAGATAPPAHSANTPVRRIEPAVLLERLTPGLDRLTGPPTPAAAKQWPELPTTDFPMFLSMCHRRLPEREFDQVFGAFQPALEQAEHLVANHLPQQQSDARHDSVPPPEFAARVTGWLRDELIGPSSCPAEALVRLRGAQVGLFRSFILLRWQPRALGADPARFLPGLLTEAATDCLRQEVNTDQAAALAIALHRSEDPGRLPSIRMRDVTSDGSGDRSLIKGFTDGPLRLPHHAHGIIAAHYAMRLHQGAQPDDLFIPGSDHGTKPSPAKRGETLRTQLKRLRITLPPAGARNHNGPHGYWMGRRQLTIHLLPLTARQALRWNYHDPEDGR